MPRFFLTIIFGIITIILTLFSTIRREEKGRKRRKVFALFSAVIAVGNLFVTTKLAIPEIYMTNGDQAFDNELYFEVEWPLSVYYTLSPYENPRENGEKFTDPIEISSSVSVSYISNLFGIIWGDPISKDIILKTNGEMEMKDTTTPGTAIANVDAYLLSETFFPGDELSKDDFRVYGTTIAGEEVVLENFTFEPQLVKSGRNEIVINYNDIKCRVSFIAKDSIVESISANYIGSAIDVGSQILKDDILVTAMYNDGHTEIVDDFSITPSTANEAGELQVIVEYEGFKDNIFITVLQNEILDTETSDEGMFLFSNFYEEHEPDSILSQVSLDYWNDEKLDVQGRNHKGNLYLYIGDLFNGIQAGGDSYITSMIHFIINPEYDMSTGVNIKGEFVLDEDSMGSDAYADVAILVDGEEVWHSDESISGKTIKPMPFEFWMYDYNYEMTMVFKCNALGNGIGVGIILLN